MDKVRKIIGVLNIKNLKSALNFGKKAFNVIRDVDALADKHHLDFVSKITDRILENKYAKNIEKGIDISNRAINTLEQSRSTGLFNRPVPSVQRPRSDSTMAREIVNNIR